MQDRPGGILYAYGKALFVVPRPESVAASLGWQGMQPASSEAAVPSSAANSNAVAADNGT